MHKRSMLNAALAVAALVAWPLADERNDADYEVAAEKCDALIGDAKRACVDAAKARFGKI